MTLNASGLDWLTMTGSALDSGRSSMTASALCSGCALQMQSGRSSAFHSGLVIAIASSILFAFGTALRSESVTARALRLMTSSETGSTLRSLMQ